MFDRKQWQSLKEKYNKCGNYRKSMKLLLNNKNKKIVKYFTFNYLLINRLLLLIIIKKGEFL